MQGVYVTSNGKLSDTGGNEWVISSPVSIPRFSTITVLAKGFRTNVAIISKYVSTDDTYVPLVISEEGKFDYTFTLTEDMNISICSSNTVEWKLYVKNETLMDYFKLVESSICIPYSISDVGSYIAYNSGNVVGGTPKLSCTDYIDVDNMDSITIYNLNYTANDGGGLAFYDINKMYISGHQYNRDINLIVDIPANAKYMRATVSMTSLDTLTIVTKSTIKEGLTKLGNKIDDLNNKQNRLEEDKTDYCQIFHRISGIGDSLMSGEVAYYDEELGKNVYTDCYNYSWLSNLCKNIGATATHYSNGGRTTKTWLQDCLATLKSENPKSSCYYIGLGTNDIRYVTLGTIEDCGTDNETFYGMYSKIIREVQAFNPHAKIFCCSLYFNPRGESVKAYCKAIREMSEKYKCYYIDFVNRFGNEYSNSDLVSCGHFTNPGYVKVAKQMQQLTNEIIRDNKDFNFLGIKYKDI